VGDRPRRRGVGNGVSMKIASICKVKKKSCKSEKYALFFEGVNFAYWSLGVIC